MNGLDRAALTEPSLVQKVPQRFAVTAQIARGDALLKGGRYREAAAAARLAVRRAPVEPESTALLGGALLGLNDAEGAQRAFLVAGRLGWRTPLTQYYWMREALAVDDYRVASLRADAMLRQNPTLLEQPALLAPLESTEMGRTALAERMLGNPGWISHYAQGIYGLSVPDVATRAMVLNILAAKGGTLGCPVVGSMVTSLVAAESISLARQLWEAHCPARRPLPATGLLSDTGFSGLQVHRTDSPFDWSVVGDSDVSLSVDELPRGQDRRLLLASSAAFPRKVLTQLVPLAAGAFRLSWRANDAGGSASTRILAMIACGSKGQWIEGQSDGNGGFLVDFDAEAACPARWVSFAIKPGSASVYLSEVRLLPRH